MKATTFKRISGLFILTFAFFVVGIPKVNAASDAECKACAKKYVTNGFDGFLERYPINVNFNNKSNQYVISLDGLASEYNSAKFKLSEIKVYDPTDEASKVKTLVKISSGLESYAVGGKITLDKSNKVYIPREKELDDNQAVTFVFVPDGYVDPLFRANGSCRSACGANGNIKTIEKTYALDSGGSRYGTTIGIGDLVDSSVTYKNINCGAEVTAFDAIPTDKDTDKIPVGSFSKDKALSELNALKASNQITEFDYDFCEAKIKAIASNNAYNFTPNSKSYSTKESNKSSKTERTYFTYGTKYSEPVTFKCDYNVYVENDASSSNYYMEQNRKYLYGKSDYEKSFGGYTYDYVRESDSTDLKCKLKCEESVVVEYGPPVASAAGLCFEYKVRVTSRVNCGAAETPTKPREQYPVCIPSPQCVASTGRVDLQGGPNEVFDACVNNCDGGKYTDKCSDKCYKEAYGNKKSTNKKTSTDSTTAQVEKVTASLRKVYDDECRYRSTVKVGENQVVYFENGYYIKGESRQNGTIMWDAGAANGNRKYCFNGVASNTLDVWEPRHYAGITEANYSEVFPFDATWYKKNLGWGYDHVYNSYSDTGIPRTGTCSETCSWIGCEATDNVTNDPNYTGKFYFSEEKAKEEAEKNKKKYEEAVATCQAAASCTTTTAEFVIGVKYNYYYYSESKKKYETSTQKIYFPYSKNNDNSNKLNVKDEITYNENNKSANCVKDTKNTTVINQDGCYACDKRSSSDRIWYRTEWTFTGTWFNQKNRDVITYDKNNIVNPQLYTYYPNKFCLPQRILTTNEDWYNVYQNHIIRTDSGRILSINDTDYINSLPAGAEKTKLVNEYEKIRKATNFTAEQAKKLDYNIFATTRDFGMFEWDIDMNCFYAVKGNYGTSSPPSTTTTTTDNPSSSTEQLKIRSVDLKNLFPDKEGNKVESGTASSSGAHYNWSKFATQTNKDTGYTSSPSEYKKFVERVNYGIYNDRYLDYEIYLTKDIINKIKNKNVNYREWDVQDSDSIVNRGTARSRSVYKSKFIRETFKGGNNKLPQESALKCNNLKNYSSTECEEFTEEGK